MTWRYTPFAIPMVITGILATAIAIFAWRRRRVPGATPLTLLVLGAGVWALGYAGELSSADLATSVFWAKTQYLGIVVVPIAWLAFVLQYTDREHWLTRRNVLLLALMPLATLLLAWTNERHHLVWSATSVNPSGMPSVLDVAHGTWFWSYIAYSYLCLLVGAALLTSALVRSPQLYREQASALMIGIVAPWAGNMLYVAGLSPWPGLDLTPFGFTVAGLAIAWSLKRFRLLDLVPIARGAVIEGMDDVVIVLDGQNRVVDLNPAAQAITGCSAATAIGRPAAQVFARWPEMVEHYREVVAARDELSTGDSAAQRWFDLRIVPMYHRRGHLTGRLVVMRDISERKRAEAALLAQKQLFEQLVTVARRTAEKPGLNDTLRNALNLSMQFTGADWGSLAIFDQAGAVTHSLLAPSDMPPQQRQEIARQVLDVGLAGWVMRERRPALVADTLHDERWLLVPDAPGFIRSALVVPMISRSKLLGVLALHHREPDHFSPADLDLIQAAADQMVLAVRNALMYNEQEQLLTLLFRAKETAEAANRAKSEFVSLVSHELKTPMAAIKGYTDLLALEVAGPTNQEQASFLGTISSNLDMMTTLVSDLADIARIEAGRLRLQPDLVALSYAVEAALRTLRGQIDAKAQTIMLDISDDLPPVWTDRTRLIQIVANLVSNAHKYTPPGGQIRIWAEYPVVEPDGARAVCLTVQDNGLGISPEEQSKIFQKFFRAADKQARESPGTGLGLSITKYLVELQGGRIWFESTFRRGTSFHFTIPTQQ